MDVHTYTLFCLGCEKREFHSNNERCIYPTLDQIMDGDDDTLSEGLGSVKSFVRVKEHRGGFNELVMVWNLSAYSQPLFSS